MHCEHMSLQDSSVGEITVTQLTLLLQTSILEVNSSHVGVKIALLTETLEAMFALEGPFTLVYGTHVRPVVRRAFEFPVARSAKVTIDF